MRCDAPPRGTLILRGSLKSLNRLLATRPWNCKVGAGIRWITPTTRKVAAPGFENQMKCAPPALRLNLDRVGLQVF